MTSPQIETVNFKCNICGADNTSTTELLSREASTCAQCRCNVRFRAVIHILSVALFGESVALPDFPVDKTIKGLGMSDWPGYANKLAEKLDYTNTFFHQEPRLDINDITGLKEKNLDFFISSDVFEHTTPPRSKAFVNSFRLLKPGGALALTVPFGKGEHIERYPDLHDFSISKLEDGQYVLRNKTMDGREQEFKDLIFHGGPGSTLEMRVYSEKILLEELANAGFTKVHIMREHYLPSGIYWKHDWSLPILAFRPKRTRKPGKKTK